MKLLRTHSSAGFLVLALLAACFIGGAASGQDSKGRSISWKNLKSLTPGQEIRVVMNNSKYYQGKFQSLSDDGITLRQGAGEETLARNDVFRVSAREGKNHQGRNAVIGALIGGGAGLVIGRSPYWGRNCTIGPFCAPPPNPHLMEILTPVGALAGAAIGAVVTKSGWHDVYRAR